MIGGVELEGHAGGGRLTIEPALALDTALALWWWPRRDKGETRSGRCMWLNPTQARELAAALLERADYLDPAVPTPTGA